MILVSQKQLDEFTKAAMQGLAAGIAEDIIEKTLPWDHIAYHAVHIARETLKELNYDIGDL